MLGQIEYKLKQLKAQLLSFNFFILLTCKSALFFSLFFQATVFAQNQLEQSSNHYDQTQSRLDESTKPHVHNFIRIIFDLDWTLLYQVHNFHIIHDPSEKDKIFEYEGDYFRVTDYAGALLQAILEQIPNSKISFFSGANDERMKLALTKIKLPDGRTAADIAEVTLSASELSQISNDQSLKFYERFKKIIFPYFSDYQSDHTLLIDDLTKFSDLDSLSFQQKKILQQKFGLGSISDLLSEKNKLRVLSSFGRSSYFKTLDSLFQHSPSQHRPSSEREWRLERNKVALILGLIIKAYEDSQLSSEPFSEIAQLLSFNGENGETKSITDPSLWPLFQKGFQALSTVISEEHNTVSLPKPPLVTKLTGLFCQKVLPKEGKIK